MKKILVAGAGRSSWSLIHYLLNNRAENNWNITIADAAEENINRILQGAGGAEKAVVNFRSPDERSKLVKGKDLVISLMPPELHLLLAKDCLRYKINLLTASYISPEFELMDEQVKKENLLFLKEMGADPGIDHMSAMELIHKLQDQGAEISVFRSYTGGLVAPESDNNPWNYKLTWNPANVVRAAQGTSQYLSNDLPRLIPYHRVFAEARPVEVPGLQKLEAYANRNSMPYIKKYGLNGVSTFMRGTLRKKGFCSAWNNLVLLGMTSDVIEIPPDTAENYSTYTWMFIPEGEGTLKERLAQTLDISPDSEEMKKIEWLGLLQDIPINTIKRTPADILQALLEEKWAMQESDHDWLVMVHEIEYELHGKNYRLQSVLDVKGENAHKTAMAQCVGLPLGCAARLILNGKINLTGVHAPLEKQVYAPVLEELKQYGINFTEHISEIE